MYVSLKQPRGDGERYVTPARAAAKETTPGAHLATTTVLKSAEKSPLDCQRQEMEENLQVLKVQIASAKEELDKLNSESRHFQSLSDIRARLCNNCQWSHKSKMLKTSLHGHQCV